MAKSVKSKQKVKIRNEKRKRYYVRELNNLKKLVEERETRRAVGDIVNWNNTPDPDVLTKPGGKLETENKKLGKPCEGMDTSEKAPKVYGKDLRDKDGNYPDWMNNKQKHKQKLKNKRMKARRLKQNKKRVK
ncbi:18 kDa learning-associated protein of slug-like [Octopus bimaculoides]|uniref:18 kDa learning-associated protein of slug-like n=1 Tax=Octopus bimaculoides TaxID=37653 RepID=UPI00071E2C8C|nr:18 kDa learning-associated protein of slug-like [Octopus bimaculoides]|eukprot:XP_014786718.1 PREDICTED: 18 kDa learning-associated protein of slug-like [Octopus bimaculoides]